MTLVGSFGGWGMRIEFVPEDPRDTHLSDQRFREISRDRRGRGWNRDYGVELDTDTGVPEILILEPRP